MMFGSRSPGAEGLNMMTVLDADPSSATYASYHRESWPNGITGMAMPHGALFVP